MAELIERSSLGTPAAKAIAARTSDKQVERIKQLYLEKVADRILDESE